MIYLFFMTIGTIGFVLGVIEVIKMIISKDEE